MRDLFAPVRSLMNSQAERPRRKQELIADFSLGYAKGWAFRLGAWARSPLCIDLADLVMVDKQYINGQEVKVSKPYRAWVQGCGFNFTAGTLIHQGNGDQKGTICSVQVIHSTSAGRVPSKGGWRFESGGVVFDLFKPVGASFVNVGVYECSQIEFIKLLRHGIDHLDDLGIKKAEVHYAAVVV